MSSIISGTIDSTQKGRGFSKINSEKLFREKFPTVTVVECDILPSSVKLDEDAFECFLTYINHSLDLNEKFINLKNEKGNYFFFFILLTFIASCAEGISASEAAVGKNDNSASSLKMGVESNIQVEDGGILINHEIALKCSKKKSPTGPVEFTTFSKIRKVCRSVLEVKGASDFGRYIDLQYQLFAQLVIAMEQNMELTPPVKDSILGAFASADSVLFARIDMDRTNDKFYIYHTIPLPFCQRELGSEIKVFNADYSKLVMEFYFSMVMNDGKDRVVSLSAIQTSIDSFRTQSAANELIRKGKIRHAQMMEQQLRESEERRIRELNELRRQSKKREEKLRRQNEMQVEKLRLQIKLGRASSAIKHISFIECSAIVQVVSMYRTVTYNFAKQLL